MSWHGGAKAALEGDIAVAIAIEQCGEQAHNVRRGLRRGKLERSRQGFNCKCSGGGFTSETGGAQRGCECGRGLFGGRRVASEYHHCRGL